MSLLHIGCGFAPKPEWGRGFREVRLDIEPRCNPDIVASMTDLGEIGPFDVVYSSHCLEHLSPPEVPVALSEMRRVTAPGGYVVVAVPDLTDVRPTDEVVYTGPAGPITGLDMYFGLGGALKDFPHMAHRTGFVADTLRSRLADAGYSDIKIEREPGFNLVATARA